jgi:hypothetical protein
LAFCVIEACGSVEMLGIFQAKLKSDDFQVRLCVVQADGAVAE